MTNPLSKSRRVPSSLALACSNSFWASCKSSSNFRSFCLASPSPKASNLAYFEKSTATALSISVSGISPDVEGALEFVEGGELSDGGRAVARGGAGDFFNGLVRPASPCVEPSNWDVPFIKIFSAGFSINEEDATALFVIGVRKTTGWNFVMSPATRLGGSIAAAGGGPERGEEASRARLVSSTLLVMAAASTLSRPTCAMICDVTVSPSILSKSNRAKRAFCSAAEISLWFWPN